MFKNMMNAAKEASTSAIEQSKKAVVVTKQKIAEFEEGNTCMSCGETLSTTLAIAHVKSLHACCSCGKMCCSNCLMTAPNEIPNQMWAHPTLKKQDYKKAERFCKKDCKDKLFAYWMDQFIQENRTKYVVALRSYITNGAEKFPIIEKPKCLEDGKLRKTMRMIVLVEYAADLVGYDRYMQALKVMAKGGGLLGVLLQNDYVAMMYPLMDQLKDFGITGPNGLLRVYYYGCYHELQRKLNFSSVLDGHRVGDMGVIAEKCPYDILDYVGRYAAAAEWLYSSKLPEPHDEDNWSSWYFSRIVGKEGWSVIAVSPSATVHYGTKCPAFALVVREHPLTKAREAILAIRGTQSAVDWSINIDDKMRPYTYRSGQFGENAIEGSVHHAMMEGALKILDVFSMRECIHQLVLNGYDIKIVGHSLGAATACLIAAELRNGFFERKHNELEPLNVQDKYQEEDAPSHSSDGKVSIPWIPAVGFGTPPCVDEGIADAMLVDNLMVSVVHCDDIVPRLSRFNVQNLAVEVNQYSAEASKFQKEDQKYLEEYAKNYGIAGAMIDNDTPRDKTMEKNDELAAAISNVCADDVDKKDITKEFDAPLVVPGKIVHLTFCNASYNATLCDHRLEALRTIVPLTSVVKNHEMSAHIEALRSMKLKQATVPMRDGPTWEPIYSAASKAWSRCHVCLSDPLWPYITKSEPTRGLVTHNCRSCGKVCCSVCSPAGDLIPADGIGKYQKLSDFKLSLPFIGLTGQQRVCITCFLHSYDMIQGR